MLLQYGAAKKLCKMSGASYYTDVVCWSFYLKIKPARVLVGVILTKIFSRCIKILVFLRKEKKNLRKKQHKLVLDAPQWPLNLQSSIVPFENTTTSSPIASAYILIIGLEVKQKPSP